MDLFTGREYLKIDIANNFGLDKENWDVRIAWFDQNESKLLELLPKADEPALYFAGVQAWNQVKNGQPIGYQVSLDGTSSGLQILSALTGDRKAASICNVIDTGNREDAYKVVYERMAHNLGESAKIGREDCKDAIMTSLYGSEAEPKKVFGEGSLLRMFFHVMEESAPAVWELNQTFLSMWNPEALSNDWVLPDNFHVHVKVMNPVKESVNFLNKPYDTFRMVNEPKAEGRSLSANTTHSVDGMIVREITRRCDYDPKDIQNARRAIFTSLEPMEEIDDTPNARLVQILWDHYEKSGYLSARIIPLIDEQTVHLVDRSVVLELIESLPAKPFKVISIHDCFRVLPNYGNDLRKQYNRQLYEIAKSNLLSYIISQIIGTQVKIGKLDYTLADDILNANYSLS